MEHYRQHGTFGAIGGGQSNTIASQHSTISGGYGNNIATASGYATIAGGANNTISANYLHGFIGGGNANTVSASCASIVGGANNTVSGCYSAILGGFGNTDSGYAYTGMYGCNLTASCMGCALWVNQVVAPNTSSVGPFGLPQGTFYYQFISAGCCAVYIA